MCKIYSRLTINTLEQRLNDIVLLSLLLTLNRFHNCFGDSIVDLEQVNADYESTEATAWQYSKK